jgi:hypothetical protein
VGYFVIDILYSICYWIKFNVEWPILNRTISLKDQKPSIGHKSSVRQPCFSLVLTSYSTRSNVHRCCCLYNLLAGFGWWLLCILVDDLHQR